MDSHTWTIENFLETESRIDRKRTNFNVKFLCASERYRIRGITQFSEGLVFLCTQECSVLASVGLRVGSGEWSDEMESWSSFKKPKVLSKDHTEV